MSEDTGPVTIVTAGVAGAHGGAPGIGAAPEPDESDPDEKGSN